jgi:anaerobic magnesium-protoporphyrin IX monomethyl ester cyclase
MTTSSTNPRRFLCAVPPTGKYVREDRCQTPIKKLKTISLRPPIDLLYCAGSVEAAGCQVLFRDYSAEELSWDDFLQDLATFLPTDLLLSITTLSLEKDLEAARLAKEHSHDIRTIAIGAHFNTLDRETLERFSVLDVVLRGEYEHACRDLASDVDLSQVLGATYRRDGVIHQNETRPFEENLDALPFPARHLAKNELYTRPDNGAIQTSIVTNRGCPFHCTYCLANQVAGTRNRYRSVENVMAELTYCVETLGIANFLFRSELFTQNKRWVTDLCKAIIASGLKISWACNSRVDTITPELLGWMRRAGCWIMAFGVESGDQETLDRVGKRAKVEDALAAIQMARAADIRSSVYLLIGLPWDDVAAIDRQISFAKRLDPDFLEIFYPYPFPGTALQREAIELGLIAPDEVPSVAYADPAMRTLHLTKEELVYHRTRALRRFYLRPRTILRTVSKLRSLPEALRYLRAGCEQLFVHQGESAT